MGDVGSIPESGRSPGEGKCYSLQYSGLENSVDRIVHGVAKSWTQLSEFHFHFLLPCLWDCLRVNLWDSLILFSSLFLQNSLYLTSHVILPGPQVILWTLRLNHSEVNPNIKLGGHLCHFPFILVSDALFSLISVSDISHSHIHIKTYPYFIE